MTIISIFIFILLFSSFLCLYRIGVGPTAPDRTVSIDNLGTLVVGFCALLVLITRQGFYLTIGISWALLSYVGTLALAKFLEGRSFDD
jgi:multicomponent Na+:H+ antiporter subunit F